MRLSILVVSRTPELLGAMLDSLGAATALPHEQVEILCSWNGDAEQEQAIANGSGFELLIAQRDAYHFASNMNGLAERASGELLLLINDDVELDPGSVDAAMDALERQPRAGLIGARLRDGEGLLTHAGILFDSRHSPYHQLDRMLGSEHGAVLGKPRAMPAVTGALMLIRREHFNALRFATDFKVCGEDVELCLDLRQRLGLEVIYAPRFSGVHAGEATRRELSEQTGNSEDLSRMRTRHRNFLEAASKEQLLVELQASVAEAEALRSLEAHRQQESAEISVLLAELKIQKTLSPEAIETLNQELSHWQHQAHALQLSRLRLEQELKHARQGA